MQLAAETYGRRPRHTSHGTPWWNDECAAARREYRAACAVARTVSLVDGAAGEAEDWARTTRREFRNAVRSAKRDFWRRQVEEASAAGSIYKIMRWQHSPGAFQAPPLQVGDDIFEDPIEEARALRKTLLERRSTNDDPPPPVEDRPDDSPDDGEDWLSVPVSVSLDEAREACAGVGNTSPGMDGITVLMLRAVWPAIGPLI